MADSEDDKRPKYPITDELRERIILEMGRQGKKQKELAKVGGVSQGLMTQMLDGSKRVKSSGSIPAICQFLGIDLTDYLTPDEHQRRVLRSLERVRDVPGMGLDGFVAEVETLARRMIAETKADRADSAPPAQATPVEPVVRPT